MFVGTGVGLVLIGYFFGTGVIKCPL